MGSLTGLCRPAVWYRFRATLARRWKGYVALVGVIGLLAAVSLGAVEFARRTQSSYPAFLKATDASDLTLSTYGLGGGGATLYSPGTERAIARLPAVAHVESWVGVFATPLEPDGAPDLSVGNDVNFAGSNTGLYFDMDRVRALQGRVADPQKIDEFMTTPLGAQLLGIRVGQVVPIGLYGPSQAASPGFGTPKVPPARRFEMKLVGIVEFNNEIVEDDTDRLPTNVVYTPAFMRQVPDADTNGTWYGIQLRQHAGSLASVEQELRSVLPRGATANFSVTAQTEAKVERAVEPESIALGVFGIIAAIACVVVALLIIGREVQASEDERRVLRALGESPATTLVDAIVGVAFAIVAGALLGCALAVAFSPIAPLGPIHRVYHPGVTWDWTVLGSGLALFGGFLLLGAVAIAARDLRDPSAKKRPLKARSSRLAQAAAGMGVPLPGVVGLRFALEPGHGRTGVPARSVLIGAVVALTTVAATLTFGDSITTLVTHPNLYGWNWNYALMSENDVPPDALKWLNHDRDVAAWSGFSEPNLLLDGQNVPALTTGGIPAVAPPVLSGTGLTKGATIVLGSATLAQLHAHLGGTVTVSYGSPNTAPLYLPPTKVVVAGTATFPAVAGSSTFAEHTGLGVGALISTIGLPAKFLRAVRQPDPVLDGPGLVFVRMRTGVPVAVAQRDMRRVVALADAQFAKDPNAAGDSVVVLSVQRPAEIVNYQATGDTPEALAAGLGAGATLALVLVLASTVRRRRTELAVLKTVGFTRRQLALALISQAAVIVVGGIVVGVPLGIALGRQLWDLFARDIDVVPAPAVPASIGLVALGAVALAVLVALVPGRRAASTPAAVVLREE